MGTEIWPTIRAALVTRRILGTEAEVADVIRLSRPVFHLESPPEPHSAFRFGTLDFTLPFDDMAVTCNAAEIDVDMVLRFGVDDEPEVYQAFKVEGQDRWAALRVTDAYDAIGKAMGSKDDETTEKLFHTARYFMSIAFTAVYAIEQREIVFAPYRPQSAHGRAYMRATEARGDAGPPHRHSEGGL